MRELKGKNAFVTGAGSGIGLGICRALAKAGVNIALADIEQEPLDKAVAEVAALGVQAFGVPLDVSDEAAVRRAASKVGSRFGDLHILSNNAGVTFAGSPLLGVPQQQLDWIFGVNVFGTLHCCRTFVPLIQKHGQGGHIVNTASIGGLQVNPLLRNGPYAMTKYAVVAMSETLALDLEGTGIGVSVFCPALVATGLYKSAQRRPERFGGAYKPAATTTTAARVMPTNAISGDEAGERVRQAIVDDEFFVFTHPQTRAWIEDRHRRLMAGFDANDRYRAGQTGKNPD
jgi:NAD(P)-dependent dehydrogenase (short-subunit alcohol dehydrogenase family)